MEDLKLTVTQEKREETMDKILNLIADSFDGIDVTVIFTKRILEDTIKVLEERTGYVSLKEVNKSIL